MIIFSINKWYPLKPGLRGIYGEVYSFRSILIWFWVIAPSSNIPVPQNDHPIFKANFYCDNVNPSDRPVLFLTP